MSDAHFVDLQINGHGGIDFLSVKDPDDVRKASRSLYQAGVAAYLPTLITSDLANLKEAAAIINGVKGDQGPDEAKILGFHLEGPFISHAKCGVHPQHFIADPSLDLLKEYLSIDDVKIVTLAPELPGALELIRYLVDHGIVASLGHSDATLDQAHSGFDAGAKTVTHLYNAMSKFPGLAQAALERDDITFQIIVDDLHVTRENVLQAINGRADRFILTNDTVAAAGIGDGRFSFGEMEIEVNAGQARRLDGTLAGGVGTLSRSLEILVEIGVNQSESWAAATTRPLALIGEKL